MKRSTLILALVTLLAATAPITALAPTAAQDQNHASSPLDDGSPALFAPGIILIGLKPDAPVGTTIQGSQLDLPSLDATISAMGVHSVEPLFPHASAALTAPATTDTIPLDHIYRLQLDPGADVLQTIPILAAHPDVAYAEPDYLAHAIVVPNDPQIAQQWGLTKIGAPTAWDTTTGDSSVAIAIVDAGLDTSHEDLAPQLWTNPGETPANGIDDDNNGHIDDIHGWNILADNADLSDNTGHGTQVSAIAAAASNNAKGIAGVCWDCRLMVVKVTQPGGVANYSDIAAGVAYAAQKGAKVINLSLGGYSDSATLRAAIASASQIAVVVGGAGNDDNTDPFYPAAYDDYVLAVAGTTSTDTKVSDSNYGSWVDVSAPGKNITTAFDGGGYGATSGTSVAAPFASGLAGLLLSENPSWSPALARAHIVQTAANIDAQNPGYQGKLGSGRIDAASAVTTQPTPDLSIQGYTVNGQDRNPEPGTTFALAATVHNAWGPASGLAGTLSTSDGYATVNDASGAFGDIASGATGSNTGDPFQVTLAANTPYARAIPFSLHLTGGGGFSTNVQFTVHVRSGYEHLPGGTVIVANTTWTSDKIYILDGNVVVDEGVTLTIEPGTLVMAAPEKWLRIDGTLSANGTADQPIHFTTTSESDNASDRWAGLRFSSKSEPGVFENGTCVSGSTLRYATFDRALTAIGINGGAPCITDSTFSFNSEGVSVNNDGRATIVGCEFSNNDIAISANSTLGYWQLSLIGNVISHNQMGIAGGGENASIEARENIIVDNSEVGAQLLGKLLFEHNLVAHNGQTGMWGEINLPFEDSTFPAVAYNSQHNEFLVIGQEYRDNASASVDILGQRVLGDGTVVGPELVLAASVSDETHAHLAHDPTLDRYLIVYEQDSSNGVYGQLLEGSGQLLGSPIAIGTSFGTRRDARAAYVATHDYYLVIWHEETSGHIYGRLVDNDGALLSDQLLLMVDAASLSAGGVSLGYSPAMDKALTVWPSYSTNGVWGQWIALGDTGVVTDTVFQIGDQYQQSNVTLAYNPTQKQFLAAWHSSAGIRTAIPPTTTIAGTPPSNLVVTHSSATEPRLTSNPANGEFLLTWRQDEDIYAQRLNPASASLGGSFEVTSAPEGQYHQALAANAANGQNLVVWQDSRDGNWSLFGQRIGSDGTLLDNPGTRPEETLPTINFRIEPALGIHHNTIINNGGVGLHILGEHAGRITIDDNNLFGNMPYDLWLESNKDIDASGNHWGSTPLNQVATRIYDCRDLEFGCPDPNTGQVTYQPISTEPIVEAPAFVKDVSVTPSLVGIQQAQFDVTFSRPMDQSVLPQVSFHTDKRGTTATVSEADGLADNNVSVIAADHAGNLWLGSYEWEGGLSFFDGQEWSTYRMEDLGLAGAVSSIFSDSQDTMWFGGDTGVSHLVGTIWFTYTSDAMGADWYGGSLPDIDETPDGTMWFAADEQGLLSFDGSTWQLHTSQQGVPPGKIRLVETDLQGNLWVGALGGGGAAMYDGQNWTYFDSSNGLPGDDVYALFADSSGGVWLGTSSEVYVGSLARFENGVWTTHDCFGTYCDQVSQSATSIAEAPDGTIWFSNSSSGLVTYDNGVWGTMGHDENWYNHTLAFDGQDNLWMNNNWQDGVRVLYVGTDYSVTDHPQWLDSTHYRASYDVTSLVPPGGYVVAVEGGLSTSTIMSGSQEVPLPAGGMPTAMDERSTFAVDYAGEITDRTPPSSPSVIARGQRADTSAIQGYWQANDSESAITRYRYAIGSAQGLGDIVSWTSTGDTTLLRSGLGLVAGKPYWLAVQARNEGGLWSTSGYGPFISGQPSFEVFLPLITKLR